MQRFHKIVALLLCMVMLVGIMPVSALAAEDTIYILAGGDFQAGDNGQEDHYYSRINMGNILDKIKETHGTMNGFIFVGDYDGDTHNDSNANNGVAAMMEEVSERFTNLNHDNSYLIEGNHETGAVSGIDATGGYDCNGYAVYLINETDFCEKQEGKSSQIQTVANNLKTWLNKKIGEGYDAPIFVATHTPLGYTTRTYTNGDSLYGKYVFDVLNDAAANGLNIIFLHGHDHAYGADNYLGGEAIYLPVGDKINICVPGDKTAWTEETLNFTYMNAGYVGYYNENYYDVTSYEEEKLTMTVFAITGNQVTVERWSKDGLYNLKSAGREGFYSNASTCAKIGLSYNTTVYASPQTITLTTASSGSTEVGTIGEYVGVSSLVEDVTTSGGKWVTITEATNGTEATSDTYQYVLDTNGIDYGSGNKYLIVARDAAYLLDAGSGVAVDLSSDGTTVTTSTTSYEYYFTTGGLITRDGTNTLYQQNWGIHVGNVSDSNLNGFTNLGNGYYRIYDTDGTARSLYWDGGSWTVTSSNHTNSTYSVRLYKFDQTIPGSEATPGSNGLYGYLDGELRYEVASGASADDALAAVKAGIAVKYTTYEDYSNVADFADDDMTWTLDPAYDGTTPGDYAVTIAYNGTVLGTAEVIVPATTTYYVAEGNGLYTVDMNTSADDALAAVKAGITVSSASDTNGTDKTTIDDADVTWNWVDKYDGTNYGPYTVEVLYNGSSLGTVEVKVNVQYETGINAPVKVGTENAGYKYVLDTDGMDPGSDNMYIVVGDDEAIMLTLNGSSVSYSSDVTISGNTATTTSRNHEFYFRSNSSNEANTYLLTRNGSSTVYHGGGNLSYGSHNRGYWYVTHVGDGEYQVYDYDNLNWYLNYGVVWENDPVNRFSVSRASSNHVRLYKYEGYTEGGDVYAYITGNTVYTVTLGKSATSALSTVKAGITGYISNNADGSNATELADSELDWKWLNKYTINTEGSYWVEISYNGKVLGIVEVRVEPGVVNNYPEYPDEGAVKVSKTATGIDFQSSGIAQVEISASGVPIKKGADVIVMLDTSSSMNTELADGSGTRAEVLEASLKNLIAQFKTPGDDGELQDLRIAIADFNGFYGDTVDDVTGYQTSTPYDRDVEDQPVGDIDYDAISEAKVYTGDGSLSARAFIDVADLADSYTLNYTSGTNYDYAFDAIYQLGNAARVANGDEERELYVIFMSDGAAMQWNYYHAQGNSPLWENWITGTWDADDLTSTNLTCTEHAYYYNLIDSDGDGALNEHRMANAIKGDVDEVYEVIRKSTSGLEDVLDKVENYDNLYTLPGLGATMYAIAFDPGTDGQVEAEHMVTSIETLASESDDSIQYFYEVSSASALENAFKAIGSEIAYAASNARYVDQMGGDYNLQLKTSTYTVVDGANTTEKTLAPVIEILTYDIYTRQDYLNGTITEDKIGDRKGTSTLNEVVKFSVDGTQAYSNLIDVDKDGTYGVTVNADGTYTIADTDDNILGTDGVIYAKTFLYNTNITDVAIEGVDIPTGIKTDGTTIGSTNVLPAETFYWKLGTVQTSELAMRYYVYLEGSLEGTREGGSYPTNEYATLYYDNYLGTPCHKETTSPVMAWKEANVSYAFYLVDENGNIIVNQTTGQTGSFANKIAVTNPVVYETVLLNNDEEVSSIDIASLGVLPEGYTLYDYDGTKGATYTVTINSNTTGSWEITTVKGVHTTYVTQYDPNNASAYSNDLENSTIGDDYTHTVVWFAVLWKVQALPDAVVIDYGLPVDISVLTNDMFGENGKLAGVGAYSDSVNLDGYDTTLASGFGTSYTGTYGSAKADSTTGKVRYTLNTSNGMQMQTYEKFAYAVNYTGSENAGYYYDTVTVIPATTIYYEDDFLTFTGSGTSWEDEGTAVSDAVQAEDRPGQYSLTDANNIYGYDGVNLGMSAYSLGTAKKVHVGPLDENGNASSATATFTFYGTGYDIISMTSNTTGVLAIKLTAAEDIVVDGETVYASGAKVKNTVVDTYYGCSYVNGEWVTQPDVEKAMYQVPVIQMEGLPYGKYTVTLIATYMSAMDDTTAEGYDLYIDAVRIYDPANDGAADNTTDTTIEDAYLADGEGWPSYIELRNKVIAANSFDNVANDALTTDMEGLVFIDGDDSVGNAQISDYISYGPNNEIYLAPGQRVAFMLNTPENLDNVHIGIKSADGRTCTYTITNIAKATDSETGVEAGEYYGEKTTTVNTTTDMYYDLTGWKNDIIVISNTGDRYNTTGILSLTNIKSTYTSDPNGVVTTGETAGTYSLRSASQETASIGVQTYGLMTASEDVAAEVETTVPETTEVPETESELFETYVYMTPAAAALVVESLNAGTEDDIPDVTEPETTVPDVTEPETTVPEETEPEDTEPETTVPTETEPDAPAPDDSGAWDWIWDLIGHLISKIFGK